MTPEHMTPLFSTRKALAEKHGFSLSPQINALIFDVVDWARRAQPAIMFNGLTEAETDATASVFGLVGAQPASAMPTRIVELLEEVIRDKWQDADGKSLVEDARKALATVKESLTPGAQPASVPAAVQAVISAMRSDPDYAWSWHCNIAMSFVDAGGDHYTANQGAARFMRLFAGVDPAYSLPAATQPAQAVPQLTGCNCRWDGETQVQWCELHAAHKEAIHDWAGRAKAAEAKLAAPQPEAQPHSLVSDREYLRIFEAARHGSSAPVGTLRGIRACIAAYEAAAPSAQAPQPEAQPRRLSPFGAVAEAMRLASLMGGSIGMSDVEKTRDYEARLRSHLIEFMYPPETAAPSAQEPQPEAQPQKLLGYLSEHTGPDGPYKWQFSKDLFGVYHDTALRVIPVYEPAAPSAQAEPQKPNYRAECWPESPHNKQAEQGGK